jgi:F0F1-type ATP synthase membrane subunit b/b'
MPELKRPVAYILLLLPLWLGFFSEEGSHASPLADLLGKTVNFVILFGGLAFVLAKPLRRFLAEMGLSVAETIKDTEKAKQEAEGKLRSLRERMLTLDQEVRKIKNDGEEAGRKEKERTQLLARREAERIRSFTAQEIQALAQGARAEIRERAAEAAVARARANIQRRLTPELHSRLIDESIRSLETLYEEPHSR